MLEGGAASQRLRPRPEAQSGMNEKSEQEQRRRVEDTAESAGAFPRCTLTHQDHRMDGFLLPLAWNGEQRFQDTVGRGKEVVQHSSMRQQRLDRVCAGGHGRLRGQRIQSLFDLVRSSRRSVEGELQHRGDERAHRRNQRSASVRLGKITTEQAEIRERVLQQSIVAFELLDQRFPASDQGRESIDRRCRLVVHRSRLAQLRERFV